MYKRARFKLTVIYSILFITIFWLTSIGLYFWFRLSLGEGYITEVRQRDKEEPLDNFFNNGNKGVVVIAGNVALDELYTILLFLNAGFIIIIPLTSWYLTGRTLDPVNKSYEQQKQFVSDASHEMRTPLAIISGELEVALKKIRTDIEYKQIITSSKEEIDRLSNLVENLLFLARGDQTGKKFQFEPIDITDLLDSLIRDYKLKIENKKLKVSFKPAGSNPVIWGQSSMLRTLFSNLIDNAVKYTPEKGRIWIKISSLSHFVIINVKDNGIGIAPDNQPEIFDRFYRADPSRSKTKGFGLGLAITKSIINMHNGRILVSSSPGKGSAFTVYLPKSL
jgi:signal transduction histidine kinase